MAEFKYKVVIKADFWGKGVSETFIYTDHFLVSFEAVESNAHYAIDTAKYLEKSWDMYVTQQGFHAPKYRVHVIIKKELPNALGLAYMPTWIHNAYLEILAGQSEHSLKETSSHEYFHITQYEYDYNEHRWIIEATATVAEDYVFPEVPGYLRFENHWYERWDKGMSLNSLHDYFEYGGSLFFKYLMENVHGTSIQGKSVTEMALLKSIWERAATVKGDNTLPSIMETLGGIPEEYKKYNKAFGDFAAAVYVKEKVPDFSFRRGNELIGKLNPESLFGHYYTFHLNKTSGEIVSGFEENLVYLTAKYFQLSIQPLKEPQPLHIFVDNYNHDLQARAITESKKEKKVYTSEEKEDGSVTQLIIPRVGGEGDENIQKMVLAISNPHRKDLGRFVIRTVIGEVPYLKEVKIKKRNDRDIYHGKWIADQYTKVGTRTLSTRKEPLKIEAGKRTDLEIELQFSNPIFGDPDVSFLDGTQKLGEARLSSSKKSEDGKSWAASLQLPALNEKTRELTLRVLVEDFKRDPLDIDPASVGVLNESGERWLRYESDGAHGTYGGADQNHHFKLQHEGGKSIVILMDASGSMKDNQKIQKAKRSAIETIQNMSSQDELSFWIFSDCGNVIMVQAFTSITGALMKAVQGIEPQSGTPLALGIRQAGDYLLKEAANEEKILVVLSDGEESCEGDPQAEAQLLATKNLQVKYGPYFGKDKKGSEEEKTPEEEVPSPEEKETPPQEDPPPPEEKPEEKEDEAPCELQSWKSYGTKKEGATIHYIVLTYEERKKDKDCFIKGKIDTYGVYYGEVVGEKDSLSWGINPQPSSTEEDQATYKTNQSLFSKLAEKFKDRSHSTQDEALKEVDRLVKRELKK